MTIDKIDLVIVTYGNRWPFLKEVIEKSVLIEEIDRVIIVNNCSEYDVEMHVKKINVSKKIEIINQKTNEGSSGGFFSGIDRAMKSDGNFIMLLDDDTYVNEYAIKNLNREIAFENLDISTNLFSFFRASWMKQKDIVIEDIENTFFEFSLKNKLKEKKNKKVFDKFLLRPYVPYAGVIFSKELIDTPAKMPDKTYFLYVDDTKFSHQLIKSKGNIYCYEKEEIIEIEESWAQKENMPFFKAYFTTPEENLFRARYNLRNRSNFENEFIKKNLLLYNFNKATYLLYVFLFYMPKEKKSLIRFNEILSLLKKGRKGQLGKKI